MGKRFKVPVIPNVFLPNSVPGGLFVSVLCFLPRYVRQLRWCFLFSTYVITSVCVLFRFHYFLGFQRVYSIDISVFT
jgi:hypothetical protein